MRHGEAVSNVKNIVSCWPEKFKNPLTKKGIKMAEKAAEKLQNKNINLIFASPLLRAKQTAEIVGKKLKIKPRFDKSLIEIGFGAFNRGFFNEEFTGYFNKPTEKAPKGENYKDVLKRILNFLKEIDSKYKNKNILIISHQAPLFILEGYVKGFSISKTIKNFPREKQINKGEIRELN